MIACSRPFTEDESRVIRRRAIFECGKLDPQAYDESTLAPFALRLAPSAWRSLAELAERCAAELAETESALLAAREHWPTLGIPRRMHGIIGDAGASQVPHPRFMRFDFHPTDEGWRVSEVNADVPGGFIEAGAYTRIVASCMPELDCPPDPAKALAQAIAARMDGRDGVALVHATSYTDDQQVMRHIGAELGRLGIAAHFAAPDHLTPARGGTGVLATNGARIAAIARFFPAEWIANLPRAARRDWRALGARLPQANPLSALLIQPKRLPLVLPALGVAMPAWSSVLPAVRAIGWRRLAPSLVPEGYVLKPTWGRVGDGVCIDGVTERRLARQSRWSARAFPREWLLQRRFHSVPLGGRGVHACIGVYVVDGRAAGAYARVSPRPLIDGRAQDAAVLLDASLDAPTVARAASGQSTFTRPVSTQMEYDHVGR